MVPCRARATVSRAPRTAPATALALAGLALAGCGGGTRQDAHEPEGNFRVRIVHASFPARQTIARPELMVLSFRNTSASTIPNLAVTVDSFEYLSKYPELASAKRPIWAIERGPGPIARPPVQTQEISQLGGGQTAYVNTWARGPLAPGLLRTFIWKVTPVKSGLHAVHFIVSAGLSGKARAVLASGRPVHGAFLVHVASAPPTNHVNPNTGAVEVGAYPTSTPAEGLAARPSGTVIVKRH
jgi:hypothetical protein